MTPLVNCGGVEIYRHMYQPQEAFRVRNTNNQCEQVYSGSELKDMCRKARIFTRDPLNVSKFELAALTMRESFGPIAPLCYSTFQESDCDWDANLFSSSISDD